jgi:hypothetical protein
MEERELQIKSMKNIKEIIKKRKKLRPIMISFVLFLSPEEKRKSPLFSLSKIIQ